MVEETVIAICTFGHVPLIESLNHHHHPHFITQTDKLRGRHVVRSADCIASHVLKHPDLMPECRLIYGCSQGTEVVVVAHAFELAHLAVEHETLLRHVFD